MSSVGDSVPEFRGLLWLAVAMALCTAPFVTYLPLWLLPALAALGWWRLQRARHGKSAPPGALRGVIAVTMAGALIATNNVGFGLESAIPLYTTFLWLKLLEVKNERDLFMAAYLSCFLAGSGVLLEQGLGHTVFAIAALLAVLAATLGHHLRTGCRDTGLRFAFRRAAALLLQAAPAAAILFLLIPRPQMPFTVERGHGTSGVSDKLRPGDFDKIALSQEMAFRVTFPFAAPPDVGDLYWRGLVLTGTDGIGWYRESLRAVLTPKVVRPAADASDWVAQEITLLPHLHSWVYALDPPMNWSQELHPVSGLVLMRDHPVTSPLTYRVSSDIHKSAIDGDGVMLNACLALPEQLDPRLGTLAQHWRDQAGGRDASASAIIEQAKTWFRQQGFTYSLEPGAMPGDPITTFLFERHSGFCSHYSSAFALLMRLTGIPARVVVGYRGGEWNDLGDFFAVRQAHAHAWCEVWEEDEHRWLRVDPTSAVVVGEQAAQLASEGAGAVSGGGGGLRAFFRMPRKWWEYVDTSWENMMFRYDGSIQTALAERLGFGAWARVALVVGGILGATVCLAGVWWLLRRRGRRIDPLARVYLDWCRTIARYGCVRGESEAPLHFAARASLALPERAAHIHAVTTAYCVARYGTTDATALQLLRSTVRNAGADAASR